MTDRQPVASKIFIEVDGIPIVPEILQELQEATVDQHTHMPGMFVLRLADETLELLDNGPFDLTKKVEIFGKTEDGSEHSLIKGEITALEPEFGEGKIAELVVRGYDKSHRLYRETKSQAFLNIKDSDLASQIAGNAGLSVEADTTSTVYDHLYQHNQSDLSFLMQRAWRIGYECFVEDGKLYFRKPPTGGAQVTLKWGDDVQTFNPRMTLAEQVDEVIVRGWDPSAQKAIVGKSTSGNLYVGLQEAKDGAKWASSFGTGKKIIVDQPVVSQAEADTLAEARLDELSGAFVEAIGTAFRRPDIKAGLRVKMEQIGNRFSGEYLVTGATHTYTSEGLNTTFTVRGTRTGLLAEQMSAAAPLDRWPGVYTAVVTNNDDPDNIGRVKVKYPWMSDDAETWWARVVSAGTGKESGFFLVPNVGDEVVVAFEQGDLNHPFVLGGVWSAKHPMPPSGGGAPSGSQHLVRSWRSTDGHHITMDDHTKKIVIETSGGHVLTLDDENTEITLEAASGANIKIDSAANMDVTGINNLNVKSSGNQSFKASGDITLKAGKNLNLEASLNTTIKGLQVSAEGQTKTEIKGAMVSINGSAMVEIKGAMVKIN